MPSGQVALHTPQFMQAWASKLPAAVEARASRRGLTSALTAASPPHSGGSRRRSRAFSAAT